MNPTYGVAAWLIIGALAGWLGSRLMKMDRVLGGLGAVGTGVLGGMVGGVFARAVFGNDATHNGYVLSTVISFGGACALLGVAKLVAKTV
jgi:uncharacterized membrane protein YeaQ/YmgE (transglycosylase-associated protein family)